MTASPAGAVDVPALAAGDRAAKGFRTGTHRLVPPAESVARVRRFLAPMGITRIANVTGLDRLGIPVVMVCRPNSRGLAVAQGKGLDLDAARASGVMESIEAYHAERIMLPLKLCSYEELRYTHRVVDVWRLSRPSDGLFDPDQPILWIEGHDLLRHEPVWAPYEIVHTNYTLSQRGAMGNFSASSNGLASGNHLLEAISHGICEVVERDATALWSLGTENERQETLVDPGSVDDPACRELLARMDAAGVAASIWDATTDIGIPAFRCTIVERAADDLHPAPPATGMGCHPNRGLALVRALTEAAQSRLTAIAGSRDDLFHGQYERLLDPDLLAQQAALLRAARPRRTFAGPDWDGETFADDVAWELQRLQATGLERVVVFDLTRPEFGIPVVRVVIPGLEYSGNHGPTTLGPRAGRLLGEA